MRADGQLAANLDLLWPTRVGYRMHQHRHEGGERRVEVRMIGDTVSPDLLGSLPVAAEAIWRVRDTGGDLLFEISQDGGATWLELAAAAPPSRPSDVSVALLATELPPDEATIVFDAPDPP